MALDTPAVLFLCAAKSIGVDFTRTLLIGRQLFRPSETALRRVFSVLDVQQEARGFLRQNNFSEPFFSLLGTKEISSLDCSSYESAGILHDLNHPIPDELRDRFSLVYDGGTLEHIFNIHQALKNAMEMVQVGGYFVQANVANNFMGHGFWQFSPETIFRAFSPANGYEVQAVFLHEVIAGGAWYLVSDPEEVQSRVQLCNSVPTYIFTIAKRVALEPVFAQPPQQSDYVALWHRMSHGNAAQTAGRKKPPPRKWHRRLMRPIERSVKTLMRRPASQINGVFKKPHYRLIDEDALLRGELE